jgi:Zn-dependent protease
VRRLFDQRLYLVRRGDPSAGIFILLLIILATQVLGRHSLPEPKVIFFILGSFVVATSIHEFSHAYTALMLGDPTARDLGRITLNPLAHFEPFGFFGMVMISLGYNFIGWGKPVPVNPNRLHGKFLGHQRGMAAVALAGPISNVIQAAVVAIPLRLALDHGVALNPDVHLLLRYFIWVNLLLASFNMIPIPPLDGYNLLMGLLPNFWYPILAPLAKYGFMILFVLFFIGGNIGGALVGAMINPVFQLLERVILGGPFRLY